MPVLDGADAAASSANALSGGYVVRENDDAQYTLMGTGSEVALCLVASEELAARGIATRVVALPCWACFEEQDDVYKGNVLRYDIPSVSLEAGATLGWHKYADTPIGIDSFGISAPGNFVFEHFGITAQTVVDHVVTQMEIA